MSTMWVESSAGQGSTFHFTFTADSAPCQARVHLRGTQPHLAGKHVLIVDDNETNRRILSLQVQSWGMMPRAAANGHEALKWVSEGDPFHVALLDMQMPEMDGLTLATEIRRCRDRALLSLVMLTSIGGHDVDSTLGESARTARSEFAAFLNKPVKAARLYDVLIGILGGQPGGVRTGTPPPRIDTCLARRLPLRILLAEDNAVNQKVALRMLSRMGYRADLAANGLEVLDALRRQSYDLVFMDLQMPEMDGIDAARRICEEMSPRRRPRIVAMTASALDGDRERCLQAGMDDYISKPVRPEELQAALERAAAQPNATANGPKDERSEIIDPGVLATLRTLQGNGEPDFFVECIDLFVQDTPTQLAALREAMRQRDAAAVKRTAHTLKGSCANMGARRLVTLCKEMEESAAAGTLSTIDAILSRLQDEFEAARDALDRERHGMT